MRLVAVHFLGAPAIGEMVEHDFENLDVRVVNPRAFFVVEPDVWR
jgi:hypothetical protein